jgi:hypothetical protein
VEEDAMKTTAMVAGALVAGLAFGMAVSVQAQEGEEPQFLGTVRARDYTQAYKMPLDVMVDRSWSAPDRIDEKRTRIHVSDLYGEMLGMTPHGDAVVFWFKDDEGALRNAVLPNVTGELYHMERAPARQISISYR